MKQTFKPKTCKSCPRVFTPTNPCNLYCSSECRGQNSYFKRNYGITEAQRDKMATEQGQRCHLCGSDGFLMNTKVHHRKLVVDHDHSTGAIRRLLCHNCNRALGLLQDSPELLRKAAGYIEAYR